jgi:uncharacterized membrane protein YbhN (UPF0104 family)
VSKRWRLLGSLTLLAFLAWRLDWGQLASALAGLDVRLWLAAAGVYLLAQAVSSLRWQMLAGALGFAGPWRRYLAYYFIGMFFNLVLPTSVGGDVVRACYLAGEPEGRRGAAFLSVFADRASGLVILVALASVAAACCPTALAPWLAGTVAALGAGAVLGFACLPALPLLGRLPRVGPRLARLTELGRVYLRRPHLLVWSTGLSVLVQLANVVLWWLVGRGLGLPVPFAYYGVAVPLVALLTLLPISLGGTGLRELGAVVLLAPVGVGAAEAVTLSVAQFAACAAASLAGGVIYLFGNFPRVGEPGGRGEADPRQPEGAPLRDAA